MLKIINPTFGSDFEIPVKNKKAIIPALMVPGTKQKPQDIGNNCCIQRDGPNAEFNIPPVSTKKDWSKYFNYCFQEGNKMLAQHGCSLVVQSSHTYKKEDLDQEDLRELFCNSSRDAYQNGQERFGNLTEETYNLRTAGLHIHVGFKPKHNFDIEELCTLSYYFDLYVTVPSILLDNDNKRRKLYGLPGDFRYKVVEDTVIYEYRSLGIGLIKNKKNINWVYDQTIRSIKEFNSRSKLPNLKTLHKTITTSDIKNVEKLIKDFNIYG